MPPQRYIVRCTLDHRSMLLSAAAKGTESFSEVLDAYPAEEPYFQTVKQNVRAELVAAFQQGLQAKAGAKLMNRQGYWTLADGTDYPPARLTGCIVHDVNTQEVFWILRSTSSFRRVLHYDDGDDRVAQKPAHLGLDVDVMLRVWFGASESDKAYAEYGQRSLKELLPSYDLLSIDRNGTNTMDARDRVVEVVMFAADYAERYASALRGASDLANRDLLAMVLNPARARPGSFARVRSEADCSEALHVLNAPQRSAVAKLRHRLEVIHGPPGTGKSTTIFGLLSARVPRDRTACVTCVTNQAVEAVCEKLRMVRWNLPFAVLGNPESLGPCSRCFLLEQQILREDEVIQAQEAVSTLQREVEDLEKRRVEVGSGTQEFNQITQRLTFLWGEKEYAERDRDAAAEFAARGIVRGTRVFVCTIASLHRIAGLQKQFGDDFPGAPHTIVVDEAGATPESYVPQILQTGVENLVLLGDHKQLPPLVLTLDIADMEAKQVNRSLMERALVQMPAMWVHRLTVQYRMPVAICELVSKLFYEHSLTTGGHHLEAAEEALAAAAAAQAARDEARDAAGDVTPPEMRIEAEKPVSLRWLVVKHAETSVGTSRQNLGEAAVIVSWLRKKVPEARRQGKTVKCLTFYRLQRNLIQGGLDDDEMKACVLSVDATQGSEADHVILSTVRSNDKGELGFCADPRRLCVALSRAKETLTIVGDPYCMRTGLWAVVWESVEVKHARTSTDDLEALKIKFEEQQKGCRKMCKFFMQGRCTRIECPYSHELPPPPHPAGAGQRTHAGGSHGGSFQLSTMGAQGREPRPRQPRPYEVADAREEARLCPFHLSGSCRNGNECSFSHSFQPGDRRAAALIQNQSSKTPCQFHIMGKCSKGAFCTFSHAFSPGDRRVAAVVRKTAERCQFWARGRCRNGAACSYSHN